MADTPLTMTLSGKVFVQFAGGPMVEVGTIDLPFVVGVMAAPEPDDVGRP